MEPRRPRWGPRERKWARDTAQVLHVGIFLVVATFLGWWTGQWLDRRLGTDPWLMLVFTLLGVAAGFIELFRVVLRISKEEGSGEDRGE